MALGFHGLSLAQPINRIKAGFCSIAANVRAYAAGVINFAYAAGVINFRNLLTPPIIILGGTTGTSTPTLTCTTAAVGIYPAWTNPANATSASLYTSVSFGPTAPNPYNLSGNLILTVNNPSIPPNAVITGIKLALSAYGNVATYITLSGDAYLNGVHGSGGITTLNTTPNSSSIGGSGNLLGLSLTPASINAGQLQFILTASGSSITGAYTVDLNNAVVTIYYIVAADIPHTVRRLNDSTPNGPVSGYTVISGAGTVLYNGSTSIATGLTGNPCALIPFRPNASPQPWMYVADAAAQDAVTLETEYLGAHWNDGALIPAGAAVNFSSNGMMKVRSDGLVYKMGIAEPQLAPVVSTQNTNAAFTGTNNLLATAIPWTNYSGANTNYNYGETNGYPKPSPDGTAPFVINCSNASFITISTLTGTANINGNASATPTTNGPSTGSSTNPGHYVMAIGTGVTPPASATVVIGAFTDGNGNVIPAGVAPLYIPSVVDVGAVIGVVNGITVPYGAQAFQIGIDSAGNSFNSNSGAFSMTGYVTTNALPSVTAIMGTLTLSYFDNSPTSGPVAQYIWKNADDPGGGGPVQSISNAIGTTTGNSFIFDASFGSSCVPPQAAGIPGLPGIDISGGTNVTLEPMMWTHLSPESVATGATAVFSAPLTTTNKNNTLYVNFNFCLTGNIYFPSAGNFTFVLTSKDNMIWGIGGGVKLVSSATSTISSQGQTITVANGYPLLPIAYESSGLGGTYQTTTVVVNSPAAGIYPIEVDYDYWYHSGRILLIMASPTAGAGATIIPPLPGNVRQNVQCRYVYRSSATGAQSNPSPESSVQSVPVTSNTYTSLWSPDPQVDVVDYYRVDSTTSDFTYVNTGPNDNSGGGTNTPVTDSLFDTELGTQLLNYDNFEPVPSIDLPQKGTCNVSGGMITWVSGGAIGGSATGFNPRWLAGTTILIGSPTSLAYVLIARPVSNTITIPGVPDATAVAYEIAEPILGAQPLPHIMGPTDNINYAFGWGDPLRPGTLYWCKGSNLDAWPDTNQQDVTDPSEALVGGDIAGAMGVIGSTKRFWIIVPNFSNAVATVTGTTGSTWTLEKTPIDRGLFMEWCIAVEGNKFFFRVADGIHVSVEGAGSQSITDGTLYPLFPHEGSIPAPIIVQGVTVYPPNDALPQLQRFKIINGYLYYDYTDTTDGNVPRTLVFDVANMAWVWDTTTPPATCHATNEGVSVQGVLVGCNDGTIRQMSSAGTEVATATVMSGAAGGKGFQHLGQLVIEYSSTAAITLNCYPQDAGNGSYGPATITLPASATLTKLWLRPSPNKWKLMAFQFSSTAPFNINAEGAIAFCKAWEVETEYLLVPIFGEDGGNG